MNNPSFNDLVFLYILNVIWWLPWTNLNNSVYFAIHILFAILAAILVFLQFNFICKINALQLLIYFHSFGCIFSLQSILKCSFDLIVKLFYCLPYSCQPIISLLNFFLKRLFILFFVDASLVPDESLVLLF